MNEQEKTSKPKSVYQECAAGSPLIAVDSNFSAHIKDTGISVSEVIDRLYVHGSVAAVVSYYKDLDEAQIKDALAYTARFMELIRASSNQDECRSELPVA